MGVIYEFGRFRLDPRRRQLSTDGGNVVPLAPRMFDALHMLVQQPAALIEKAALIKAIWPGVAVADNSLDQIISRLRRSLVEGGAYGEFISTERGRGYRFNADVKVVATADGNDRNAHQLHLQAVTLSLRPAPDNLRAAFELLQQALVLNPEFAAALAYRALLRTVFVAFDLPMPDALNIAEREARRALELDPVVAYGHHGLANVCALRGEWNEAADHYEAACHFEPEPHARVSRIYQLYQSAGHLRRSLTEAESIDRLAPSQPLGTIAAALAALLLGRDADARDHADRACAFGWPRTNPALQDIYFQLAIRSGRFRDAADSISSALSTSMRNSGGAEAIGQVCAALEGSAARDAAIASLCALTTHIPREEFGLVDRRRLVLWLTMLDALDEAFELANASLDHFARSGMIGTQWGMLWLPEMRRFRADARFRHLVTRLRLPDYWRRHGPPDGEFAERESRAPGRSNP